MNEVDSIRLEQFCQPKREMRKMRGSEESLIAPFFRPLRIKYFGAYYHMDRKLLRRIEQIRGMVSPTSIQEKT